MTGSKDRILFWCLLVAQSAGCQVIIWGGIPVYQRLRSGAPEGASAWEIALALFAVVVMQIAHWLAYPLKQRLQFRHNAFLGQVLVWIGELSLFFAAALTSLILFDRLGELVLMPWKFLLLGAILFAVTCHKQQILSVGEEMISPEAGDSD